MVAVIILIAWILLPLMSNSSLDASVSAGNPFRSKVSDIGSLMGDIPSEGGAPGSPLSGEMTDNPATSGESLISSLFQSEAGDEETAAGAGASAGVSGSLSGKPSASAPAPSLGAGRAKLAPKASITGGNSNSMSTGGPHNKFFGNGNAKNDIASAPDLNANIGRDAAKKSALVAMLGNAADKSKFAAKTGGMDAARGGAASAFEKSAKAGASDLNTALESNSAAAGLSMGQAAQDLKRNDPSLNSHKVQLPQPKVVKVDDTDEQLKKMIMQMIIQATLGQIFGGMGQMMAQAINPNYMSYGRPMGSMGAGSMGYPGGAGYSQQY
ncbi:MAG: hypothetical protein A2021_02950 [Elusimicrobia bacterium GWF2_52_66]|nr:MAG: hypothetical protein A2X33_08765 [Elusimicrobia bacterium GWA2_51_34]OGR87073.1 MAG: hypothetical protein A2021_02950 [Elusimicrobia bacterium GWF2_52_66]HAF96051.1 hypothetical protein [Elusimicrobiota bacterium]HCE98659.1 hypothetical protein [Elusimicrobiota bacterium]